MQRWLFFIILCPCFLSGQRTSIDIQQVEISYWLAGPRAATDADIINARTVITFEVTRDVTSVNLPANGLTIHGARKREGREKEPLTYRLANGMLEVKTALKAGEKHEWVIDYQMDLSAELYVNYIQKGESFLAFNPFNVSDQVSAGMAGIFYLSLAGDESQVLLNITVKETRNSGFPGKLEFETNNNDGTKSQFWISETPFSPEAFYLVVGEFKDFEAEDLEKEFEFNAMALRSIREEKAKVEWAEAIRFFGLESEAFTDSQYRYLDSLSKRGFSGFFIEEMEPDLEIGQQELSRRKALALHLEDNDTGKASQRLWEQTIQKRGTVWKNAFLDEKWKGFGTLSPKKKKRLLTYRLEQWKVANSELLGTVDTEEMDTVFLRPLLQSVQLPLLHISYRYIARDTALYVSYRQDTALAPVYHIPLQVNVYFKDEAKTETFWIRDIDGQLKIIFPKVPSAAFVNFGSYFPGRVVEEKPDSYLLFQLSRANTVTERKEALQGLFKTKNPNLFSTALGIAMIDEDAVIRLLALQNADNLNVPAQQKLRDALVKLTNDPSAEVQELAVGLVEKYY